MIDMVTVIALSGALAISRQVSINCTTWAEILSCTTCTKD